MKPHQHQDYLNTNTEHLEAVEATLNSSSRNTKATSDMPGLKSWPIYFDFSVTPFTWYMWHTCAPSTEEVQEHRTSWWPPHAYRESLGLSCLESHTVCARHVPPNIHLSQPCQRLPQIPLSDVWATHKDRLGWSSSASVTEHLCWFWYLRKGSFHNCGFKIQYSFGVSLCITISGT